MEYLEIFNEDNEPLHQVLPRGQVHAEGHWHRTAQIYVFHPQFGYLCHQRSAQKDLFPSLWDISIGGHLAPQETYLSCATRELGEELGIVVRAEELHHITTVTIDGQDAKAQLLDREHAAIFLYHTHLRATEFNFQQEEIEEVAYLTPAQLVRDLRAETPTRAYIPLQQHFLAILFQINDFLQKNKSI